MSLFQGKMSEYVDATNEECKPPAEHNDFVDLDMLDLASMQTTQPMFDPQDSMKIESLPDLYSQAKPSKRRAETQNALEHQRPRDMPANVSEYFHPCEIDRVTGERIHRPLMQCAAPIVPSRSIELEPYAEDRKEENIHRDILLRMQAIGHCENGSVDQASVELHRYFMVTYAKELIRFYKFKEPEASVSQPVDPRNVERS